MGREWRAREMDDYMVREWMEKIIQGQRQVTQNMYMNFNVLFKIWGIFSPDRGHKAKNRSCSHILKDLKTIFRSLL